MSQKQPSPEFVKRLRSLCEIFKYDNYMFCAMNEGRAHYIARYPDYHPSDVLLNVSAFLVDDAIEIRDFDDQPEETKKPNLKLIYE